jgi:hypothetical protein
MSSGPTFIFSSAAIALSTRAPAVALFCASLRARPWMLSSSSFSCAFWGA